MSTTYTVKGIIESISQPQEISATFRKREFSLTVMDKDYQNFIGLEFVQDKCEILNQYQVGMEVEVSFNLRGRKWTNPQGQTKYFNTLQAWMIKNAGQQNAPAPYQAPVQQALPPQNFDSGLDEDVPF